ncbi:hypothetical protein ACIQUF_15035 [Pseudomonas sp. NPDC090233]
MNSDTKPSAQTLRGIFGMAMGWVFPTLRIVGLGSVATFEL